MYSNKGVVDNRSMTNAQVVTLVDNRYFTCARFIVHALYAKYCL